MNMFWPIPLTGSESEEEIRTLIIIFCLSGIITSVAMATVFFIALWLDLAEARKLKKLER